MKAAKVVLPFVAAMAAPMLPGWLPDGKSPGFRKRDIGATKGMGRPGPLRKKARLTPALSAPIISRCAC